MQREPTWPEGYRIKGGLTNSQPEDGSVTKAFIYVKSPIAVGDGVKQVIRPAWTGWF